MNLPITEQLENLRKTRGTVAGAGVGWGTTSRVVRAVALPRGTQREFSGQNRKTRSDSVRGQRGDAAFVPPPAGRGTRRSGRRVEGRQEGGGTQGALRLRVPPSCPLPACLEPAPPRPRFLLRDPWPWVCSGSWGASSPQAACLPLATPTGERVTCSQ